MLTLQVGQKRKLILGSIQLPSFLAKSTEDVIEISDFALKNAKLFKEGGFDGVFIQDTTPGDLSIDTIANLAAIVKHVKDQCDDFHIGTQMECDNAKAILAVAKASTCSMVRIKNYVGALLKSNGVVNGQGPEAYRYKIEHGISSAIFSDIFNQTGVPIGNLTLKKACSMALKAGASALIICGQDFDETIKMLQEAKSLFPDKFVICGGNATAENVNRILEIADGVIVSTCLKTQNGWDPEKIREFIESARRNEKE